MWGIEEAIWRAWPGSLEFGSPGRRPPGQKLSWDVEARGSGEPFCRESPAGHRCKAVLQEQGPSEAPSGRFLRAWLSLKNPQNPTGGGNVWVAVILKGCRNRTLRESQPCPHQGEAGPVFQWLQGHDS